jgi:hypothetical protein
MLSTAFIAPSSSQRDEPDRLCPRQFKGAGPRPTPDGGGSGLRPRCCAEGRDGEEVGVGDEDQCVGVRVEFVVCRWMQEGRAGEGEDGWGGEGGNSGKGREGGGGGGERREGGLNEAQHEWARSSPCPFQRRHRKGPWPALSASELSALVLQSSLFQKCNAVTLSP